MSKTPRKRRTRAKTRRPRGRVYQIKNPTCRPGPETEEMTKAVLAVPTDSKTYFEGTVINGMFKPLAEPAVVPMKRVPKTVRWPATWWQHVKHDLYPIWAQLRWPVRYEEVTYWTEVVDRDACPTNPFVGALVKLTSDGCFTPTHEADPAVIGRVLGNAVETESGFVAPVQLHTP